MSFLLVFSAVFNALTGAFVGVCAADPVPHQQVPAGAPAAREIVQQEAVPLSRPVAPPSGVAAPVVAETPAPPASSPRATDRLIE